MSERIAVSYPDVNLTGGVERVVVESVNHLVRRGHDVHLLAASVADGVLVDGVTVHRIRLPRRVDPLFAAGFRERATTALRRTGPYHAHAAFSALSPLGGTFWVPSVHAASYEAIMRWRTGRGRWVQRVNPYHRVRLALEKQYMSPGGYARLIAQTEQVKADAVRLYGTPPQDVDVVELGVDTTSFAPARRAALRASSRATLGIDPDARVVAFVANELERKGFATLAAALARLGRDDVTLLTIGRTDADAVRAEARSHGIAGRTVVAGSSTDMAVPLAAADMMALPTRYEPWGLVIVEALATGIPVVTTRLAGAAQQIEEGRTGALIDDPDDVAGFAHAIAWALSPDGPAEGDAIAASVGHLRWETVLDRFTTILVGA
ncbi:D-inositol 3-phosphate glycosyltransferase [Baekduia alba]|uniref:glycosyltransferase family 4 protein n=1 Tax=Baekduia alba TaxID=2997333 RepID=UPI0023406C99|nr:glycosyltransferase family 4 protein [Baekduia alba]WCB96587.1 D-inositol 3-phosphate glycosyltransferase [Baekduia alba]